MENTNSRDRISRLFLWLDEKLNHLEQHHLLTDGVLSSAEHEKDARTMISLIRVYEKLVEMKERLDEKERGTGAIEQRPGSVEAERICERLADRIERLQKQEARRSEKTER
jgi:hypothetical protein